MRNIYFHYAPVKSLLANIKRFAMYEELSPPDKAIPLVGWHVAAAAAAALIYANYSNSARSGETFRERSVCLQLASSYSR